MVTRRIEARVLKLLQEQKVQRPPVPVEAIARSIGAEIRYSPFEGDISGMVYRDKDRTVIGVNSLHHPHRQRFTIAHEIGHLLLHKGTEVHVDKTFRVNLRDDLSSQAVDKDEIEANRFAAELLIPKHMLLEDLKGREFDFESEENIRGLAAKYRVSTQAVTFRLINLGIISLA